MQTNTHCQWAACNRIAGALKKPTCWVFLRDLSIADESNLTLLVFRCRCKMQRAASSVVCMEMCLCFFVLWISLWFVLNEEGGQKAPNTRILIFAAPSSMFMLEVRSRPPGPGPCGVWCLCFVFGIVLVWLKQNKHPANGAPWCRAGSCSQMHYNGHQKKRRHRTKAESESESGNRNGDQSQKITKRAKNKHKQQTTKQTKPGTLPNNPPPKKTLHSVPLLNSPV